MKEEATKAGRLYGVCSAGECIVTDAETGFVLATIDGTKQEAFIAPGSLVYVSDDAAVVTEVFKLAPRLKLTLLQGVAGGWLPKGFTELEYLESSGTQYINTECTANNDTIIKTRWAFVAKPTYSGFIFSQVGGTMRFGALYKDNYNSSRFDYGNNFARPSGILYEIGEVYDIEKRGRDNYVDGVLIVSNSEQSPFVTQSILIGNQSQTYNSSYRLYYFVFENNSKKERDFVPVLDADGTPCVYDKISKQCFYNAGSGTFGYRVKRTGETVAPMSLRDPWRVAPSGVYARKVGENELEVLADTEETTGEGWEWFANTAEAYENFGITQDELLT